ncbi:hypothetical protein LXA43DRAFT_941805 [Ganoderma leucocontextum]|nr:hypothetical protein LXA43DRAFT_941805 [Ganoderma leucocontextum]
MTVPSPSRLCPRPSHDARGGDFREPPYKRAKTHHAPYSPSTAQPCGDKSASAAIAFLPTCDQSPRPLTSCASNFNEVREPQVSALGNFQGVLSLPFDHRVPQGLDYASLFGNPTAPSRTGAAPADDYIPQDEALSASSSNSPPSPTPSQLGPQMIFNFGPEADSPSFSGHYAAVSNEPAPTWPEASNTEVSYDLFNNISFTELLSSGSFLEAVDPLSVDSYNHNTQQVHPPSPLSRSMSRSSFASSSYPEDYPTPASDTTAVTTPAPSEGCFGSPSEHPQVLSIGHDFLLAVEAKKREHELSYVSGSAPFSPTSFMFDFSLPQATTLPPALNAVPLSTVRRHSEPANLAACNFPSFFVPCHEVSKQVMSVPADSMTHSIKDNLASSSSASASHSVSSSIAPHQTQLPRAVELQHPRPVRAFKPQILLSGQHYDPKDFVRRRSEPIIPLPELDVASHVPLDVVYEDDEDEDSMEVENSSLFEDVPEESCDEQSFYFLGSWTEAEDLFLLGANWSWPQSVSTGTHLAHVGFGAVGRDTY